MQGIRGLSAFVTFLCGCASFGSFELVMIVETGVTGVGPIQSRVHRYDGNSGVYLGGFGNVNLGLTNIAADRARGEAFLSSSNATRVYDFNTGAFLRSLSFGGRLRFFNGDLYRSSGGSVFRVDPITGLQSVVSSGVPTVTDFVVTPTGNIVTVSDSDNSIRHYSSTGSFLSAFTSSTSIISNSRVSFETGSPTPINVYTISDTGTGTTRKSSVTINGSGVITGTSMSVYSTTVLNSMIDVGTAHNGGWVLGRPGSSGIGAYRTLSSSLSITEFFFTPQAGAAPSAMAVVLAPEPGALIGMATALALLVRRRTRTG